MHVEDLMRSVLQSVEPQQHHVEEAKRSHAFLRSQLETGRFGARIDHSRLIGSYARHTAVAPIDDIDILFVLKPECWRGLVFGPDPNDVLRSFHGAIKYRYRNSSVRRQRRSVGLIMSRRAIDVVPALPTQDPDVFLIPDRREDQWIETAPTRHAAAVIEANAQAGGLLVPTIKLAKYWNQQLPKNTRLKSFAVETVVTRMFRRYSTSSLGEAFRNTLDFIVHCGPVAGPSAILDWPDDCGVSLGRFRTIVPDVAGLGDNVVAGIDTDTCIRFVDKARINRDRLQTALEMPTTRTAQRQIEAMFKCEFARSSARRR